MDRRACVPVPLHWTRLFFRTYNQSALLASEIVKVAGGRYAPSLLVRGKKAASQGYLSSKERQKNVAGAFRVPQSKRQVIAGKKIVLVDDVFTTGATLNACVKILLSAGASEVHALTLSRVVKGR